MNIAPVISSSVFPAGLFDSASSQPVDYLFSGTSSADAIASTISGANIVDISALGNLLSVALAVGNKMLQPVTASSDRFAAVVAETQLFVDAFNSFLQSGLDNSQNPSGFSLSSQLVQQLNAPTTSVSGAGLSILERLASVGVNYQPSSALNDTGQLTIDLNALQAAFNADPGGTSTLLGQSFQSIGQLAAEFTGLVVQLGNLTQTGTATISSGSTASGGTVATTGTTAVTPALIAATTDVSLNAQSSAAATTAQLAATPQTRVSSVAATQAAATAQAAVAPLSAQVSAATTARLAATPQTTAPVLPAATVTATTPVATTATPSSTATEQRIATNLLTAAEQVATTVQTTRTAQTNTIAPTTTVTELPATITQAAANTSLTAVTTEKVSSTAPRPLTTAEQTTAPAPATTTAAPTATTTPASLTAPQSLTAAEQANQTVQTTANVMSPQIRSDFFNAFLVAINPATAAAIAAYHLVDGVFDTGKQPVRASPPAELGDSEIWPVERIRPVKLDLYV